MPEPEPTVDAHPHQLSGGQRQRIMIALAVALGSGLVIAHEPSPALDATIRAQIRTVIKDVRHPEGTAALPSTHALGAITEIADRVVIMQHGMVGESGASAPVRQALRHLSTRMLIGAVPGLTPPDRSQRPHGSPALLLANLEKTCGSSGWFGTGRTAHAAKGVTVERRPHDSLGMVDESGSGTSTVAGDVVRLADPSSGRLQQ